ncbi:MAG TPA: hypothetical protein VGO86_02875, partial [Candidatus Dormibacteraeota bacterium]
MEKRRIAGPRWLAGASPLLLVFVLACSATGGTQQAQSTPSGPVTLKLEDYSVEQVDFHKQVAAEYHRLNPNVTIEWQSIQQA